jgi:proteasome beta subunit
LNSPAQQPSPYSLSTLMSIGDSSFYRLVREHAPMALSRLEGVPMDLPHAHGTTIFALHYRDGVVMAGDRRATQGNLIAQRDLRKLEPADSHSCIAFAGSVSVGKEMVGLFQVELAHYEKIEGVELSFPAKANRVAVMLRGNLEQAIQGLAVVPVFAGWDKDEGSGRIFTFDIAGSPSEEQEFGGSGSGWHFAKGALKKLYRPELERDEAVRIAVQALFDAADDDTATGGPDASRQLYPTVAVISADGYSEVSEEELATHVGTLTL